MHSLTVITISSAHVVIPTRVMIDPWRARLDTRITPFSSSAEVALPCDIIGPPGESVVESAGLRKTGELSLTSVM